jgi:hypothetical protein
MISFLIALGTAMRKSFLMTWPFRNDALTDNISSITVAGILQCIVLDGLQL